MSASLFPDALQIWGVHSLLWYFCKYVNISYQSVIKDGFLLSLTETKLINSRRENSELRLSCRVTAFLPRLVFVCSDGFKDDDDDDKEVVLLKRKGPNPQ